MIASSALSIGVAVRTGARELQVISALVAHRLEQAGAPDDPALVKKLAIDLYLDPEPDARSGRRQAPSRPAHPQVGAERRARPEDFEAGGTSARSCREARHHCTLGALGLDEKIRCTARHQARRICARIHGSLILVSRPQKAKPKATLQLGPLARPSSSRLQVPKDWCLRRGPVAPRLGRVSRSPHSDYSSPWQHRSGERRFGRLLNDVRSLLASL